MAKTKNNQQMQPDDLNKAEKKPITAIKRKAGEKPVTEIVDPKKQKTKKSEIVSVSQLTVEESDIPDEQLAKYCVLIGQNIRMNRKLRKFSIDNLADYLGLSSSYVGLLERGERCPSLKTLIKICDLFGLEFGDLPADQGKPKNVISESKSNNSENKHKTIFSLVNKLSETELEFVISILKSLKNLQKNI